VGGVRGSGDLDGPHAAYFVTADETGDVPRCPQCGQFINSRELPASSGWRSRGREKSRSRRPRHGDAPGPDHRRGDGRSGGIISATNRRDESCCPDCFTNTGRGTVQTIPCLSCATGCSSWGRRSDPC